MSVTITNGTIERNITCPTWALMGRVAPSGWSIVANSCAQSQSGAPFATDINDVNGAGSGGLKKRAIYSMVIPANGVLLVPPDILTLPSAHANVTIEVRRQTYLPSESGITRDFSIDNTTNQITFVSALHSALNGLTAHILALK